MDSAAVKILLSQGDLSLKAHSQRYLDLVSFIYYDDDSLCKFFWAGLNTETNFVEWVLFHNETHSKHSVALPGSASEFRQQRHSPGNSGGI